MENLTLSKVLSILRYNIRIILLFALVSFVTGILYATTIFKPSYESTARLLVKNHEQTAFVTEFGAVDGITPLTRDGNPTLTQMQILTSGSLADEVWSKISQKYKFHDDPRIGTKLMQKAVKVKNPVGTDVIEVTAKWQDPAIAKDIASEFVEAYIAINVEMSKKSIVRSQEAIDRELKNAEANLQEARNKIRQFREANSTVNIDAEAENIVMQAGSLESRYNEVLSSAGAARNRVNSIAGKLGLNWYNGINSVALGHNATILELQSRLGQSQEELASLSSKYAQTHPAVVALNTRINQIKQGIKDHTKLTIGSNSTNNTLMISDPVRTSMMESLASSEAEYNGLMAQGGVLRSALANTLAQKSTLPLKQLVLSNLVQEETNWSNIFNALKSKQLEAEIRESGIISNINIIDKPLEAIYPAFPARVELVGLFTLLGMLLGAAGILFSYLAKDTYDDVDQIEEELKSPVLGVIPWLDKQTYNDPASLLALDDTASFYSLAYQKVISGLRIRGYNSGMKSFVFTSTEFSKGRSTVLMNIAYGLNRAGRSVVVVDADFRTPSIHREFGLKVNEQFNLCELLINITKEVKESGEFNWKYLSYFIHKLPEAPNLHIIPNIGNVSDPNEFLYSTTFNMLMEKLKEQYDWVLIDTPPALAVPDAATISSYSDGVILITGIETTRSILKKVNRLFSNYHIPVFGIIAREVLNNEAILSNSYIKQMISNMIPQGEEVINEK